MPAGPFETSLVAAGSCIAAASTYFYRTKQTLPFKVHLCTFSQSTRAISVVRTDAGSPLTSLRVSRHHGDMCRCHFSLRALSSAPASYCSVSPLRSLRYDSRVYKSIQCQCVSTDDVTRARSTASRTAKRSRLDRPPGHNTAFSETLDVYIAPHSCAEAEQCQTMPRAGRVPPLWSGACRPLRHLRRYR